MNSTKKVTRNEAKYVNLAISNSENIEQYLPLESDRTTVQSEYIRIKQELQKEEKKRLAEFIVDQYIEDLDSVAIDAGSTSQQIVEQMMQKKQFLSLLTNNMTAFMRNSRQGVERSANEFILTGGKYVSLFDALLGNETINSFELFHPNVILIGVSGLIATDGFFCHGNDEINVKKLLFNKDVGKIIIPVDYNKLGRSDSYLFGTTAEFQKRKLTECIVVTTPPIKPTFKGKVDENQKKILNLHTTNLIKYKEEKKKLLDNGLNVVEAPSVSDKKKSD